MEMTKEDTPESSLLSSEEEEYNHGIDVITGVPDNNQTKRITHLYQEKKSHYCPVSHYSLTAALVLFRTLQRSKNLKTRSWLLKGKAHQTHLY